MEIFNKRTLKIIKRILFVVIAICLGFLSICYLYGRVLRKYVYPLHYQKEIVEGAKKNGLDVALIFAVVKTESGFDQRAVSNKGAVGLMQIMPSTAEFIARKKGVEEYDLYDANTNVSFGCYYIKYLFSRFEDKWTALCAYNAGEGKVRGWLANREYSTDSKTLNKIPYRETQEYIKKIQKSFTKYRKLYGKIVDKE